MAGVCVFCGSRRISDGPLLECARTLGSFLAARGLTTIYGGGGVGVMGTLADAVIAQNGQIIGVIPQHLTQPEVMHAGVTDMRVTNDMHERKAMMHRLTDMYVVLPGGFGTMEELFEAVTWAQLQLHSRPIAILNVDGLYDGLQVLFDSMERAGFLSADCRSLVTILNDVEELLAWIDRHAPFLSASGAVG